MRTYIPVALFLASLISGCGVAGSSSAYSYPNSVVSANLARSAVSVEAGGSVSDAVLVSPVPKTTPPAVSVHGLPSGVTAVTGTVTAGGKAPIVIAASSSAPAGTYQLAVTVIRGTDSMSLPLSLTVGAGPSLQATLANQAVSVVLGNTATDSLEISASGSSQAPSISVIGVPAGVTAMVSAVPASPDFQISIASSLSAQPGNYSMMVVVSGPLTSMQLPLALTISPAPSVQASLASTTISVAIGSTTSDEVSISQTGLTQPPTISITSAPSNFATSISGIPGSENAEVEITPGPTVLPGTYPMTVLVTSEIGSIPLSLCVVVWPAIQASLVSPSLAVRVGSSATDEITIDTTGMPQPLSVTAAGAPAGIAATLSGSPASGSVAMNVIASADAVVGVYQLNISVSDPVSSTSLTLILNVDPSITANLATSSITVPMGGTATDDIWISESGTTDVPKFSVIGAPGAVSVTVSEANAPGGPKVTVTPSLSAAAGTYSIQILVTSQVNTIALPLTLVVTDPTVYVSDAATRPFREILSTGIDPTSAHLSTNQAELSWLSQLTEPRLHVPVRSIAIPQISADKWDFSLLDSTVQPVLTVGDHSPMLRIAGAPAFMYDPDTGSFEDTTYNQFAAYAQSLVSYYNSGGFSAPDGYHVSPSLTPVKWWSIYNEPNAENAPLDPEQYVAMYNSVVPAMQEVDPSLKFVALEVAGCPMEYLSAFLSGVTAQFDAVALHFYSTDDQNTTDAQIMATIPDFAARVAAVYTELGATPSSSSVPVWVTEDNVNGDGPQPDGMSENHPNQAFVYDQRNYDGFFTAWRPFVFSQFAKAGGGELYQWDYTSKLFGETNRKVEQLRLAYWVDLGLAHELPATVGAVILQTSNTDAGDVEELAVRYPDNSVVVMLSDHGVADPLDNDGHGLPRTIDVDVSAFGAAFSSAFELAINADTDVANGPAESPLPPSPIYQAKFSGYGVWILRLQP